MGYSLKGLAEAIDDNVKRLWIAIFCIVAILFGIMAEVTWIVIQIS